jgi:hypothetical protein
MINAIAALIMASEMKAGERSEAGAGDVQLFMHKHTGQVAALRVGNDKTPSGDDKTPDGHPIVTVDVPYGMPDDLLWPEYKSEDQALAAEVNAFGAELARRNPLVSACALGSIPSTGEQIIGVGMITEDWLPYPAPESEPLPLKPPLRVVTFPYAVFFC